jgi:hypothetical protein
MEGGIVKKSVKSHVTQIRYLIHHALNTQHIIPIFAIHANVQLHFYRLLILFLIKNNTQKSTEISSN